MLSHGFFANSFEINIFELNRGSDVLETAFPVALPAGNSHLHFRSRHKLFITKKTF